MTIEKSLFFPLRATTLTEKECNRIQAPIINTVLPLCGFARNFPRAIAHASTDAMGLGIQNLFSRQGIEHILALVQHGAAPTITGSLIRATIESLKVECGVSTAIFTYPFQRVEKYVTKTWVTHAWKFCSDRGLTIEETTKQIPLQCEGDRFIMDKLLKHQWSTGELRQINMCRMYLRATTMADIASGDGLQIGGAFLEGT